MNSERISFFGGGIDSQQVLPSGSVEDVEAEVRHLIRKMAPGGGLVACAVHNIGKNIVAMMLEGAGFDVVDLGVDVESETFVKTAAEKGADVIALSALLTTTMPAMESVVRAVKKAGISAKEWDELQVGDPMVILETEEKPNFRSKA